MLSPGGVFSADHPRIRGEHAVPGCHPVYEAGSSPHTRGARLPGAGVGGQGGIIPAYAGSTGGRSGRRRRRGDHPRIRGEHRARAPPWSFASGSSPHTRGARRPGHPHPRRQRIIPAYAGSTRHCSRSAPVSGDHPRIRGEHQEALVGILGAAGSSPHTRGAPCLSTFSWSDRRIIPAYAGSTKRAWSASSARRDHPRIRGEHPEGRPRGRLRPGIIPAYAGSTWQWVWVRRSRRHHPRIRGEHVVLRLVDLGREGSSPHTRGARSARRPGTFNRRIIPAYAGSTFYRRPCARWRRDHPRIRGEHSGAAEAAPRE